MTEEKKVLRQAENKVNITGELVEKEFEIREFTNKRTGDKYNAAIGEFSVRTGENEVHKIRFFKKEKTNKGEISKAYKGMVTANEKYISVADIAEIANEDEEKAKEMAPTKVNVTGNIGLNEFYTENEELRQYPQINLDFISEVKANENYEPKAIFDLEGIVKSVRPEMKDDDETGRTLLSIFIPLYNGVVIPFDLTVVEQGRDYVEDNFVKGASVSLLGSIVNIRKVHIKEEEMGFGGNKKTETYEYLQEHLVTAATLIDEDSNKAFNLEALKESLIEREKFLENKKTEAKNSQNSTSPKNRNTFGSSDAKKPIQKKDIPVDVSNLF